ncbi:DUF1566 domain-containing protein [bacterium]|nr:DUF1566 domain-containing protein [bacterium]
MKKPLLLLIALIFLTVSCSSSKKAENDTDNDILPDEDAADADGIDEDSDLDEEATDDEDNNDELNDTDEDETEDIDPCEPNPCEGIKNSTGECTKANNSFICSCEEGHYWHGSRKGCLNDRPAYANVCTGQTKCYDNGKEILCPAENEEFFGQDAQYARLGYCVPQSFSIDNSVEDEPVVIDNNLGLMWQRNKIPPVEELYIEDVKQHCSDLVYGGYDDWRLPTMEDFLSIADYGKYPALDTKYFPDSGKFWTATIENDSFIWVEYPTYQRLSIIFDFNRPAISDVITYEADYYDNSHKTYSYSFKIRCVRGNYITWGNTYDLIFTRTKTAHTWREALQYCSELDYAGISDWRVPNVKELIMNSLDGFHSSTTKISDPAFDHKYEKNEILENTLCVANDPCGKGKFWNGEKCVKNPCADNPCGSEDALNKICKPIDEEKYFCGCSKCMYEEHSNGKCFEDMVGGIDCYCDSGYFWDEYSDKCLSD